MIIIISMRYRLLVAENCPKLFFCHIFSSKQNSQPLQMFTVEHFLKVKMLLHYHSNDILAVMCSYAATKQEKGIENKIHYESKEKMLSFFLSDVFCSLQLISACVFGLVCLCTQLAMQTQMAYSRACKLFRMRIIVKTFQSKMLLTHKYYHFVSVI